MSRLTTLKSLIGCTLVGFKIIKQNITYDYEELLEKYLRPNGEFIYVKKQLHIDNGFINIENIDDFTYDDYPGDIILN
jgi:hypothetical protein